jgi:NAD(P)-dependent dehydrogenase (short-subunit alcohol dehydrogenase family)
MTATLAHLDTSVQASFRLDGRTALIAGAGRGLGAEIARVLAEAGARLILVSRSDAELQALAAAIESEHGVRPEVLTCDVTDAKAMQDAIAGLDDLDILVNNAGTNQPEAFVDVSLEALDRVILLNLRAAFTTAQAAARKMLQHPQRITRGGAIVNISSQMGHVGAARRSVYCMTKHGLEGLTKAAAVELAPYGITVSSLSPTFVETPMTAPFFADPAFKEWVYSRIPRGRLLGMREVALGVLYLVSPAAAMVTGSSLLLDGGWTAQ